MMEVVSFGHIKDKYNSEKLSILYYSFWISCCGVTNFQNDIGQALMVGKL